MRRAFPKQTVLLNLGFTRNALRALRQTDRQKEKSQSKCKLALSSGGSEREKMKEWDENGISLTAFQLLFLSFFQSLSSFSNSFDLKCCSSNSTQIKSSGQSCGQQKKKRFLRRRSSKQNQGIDEEQSLVFNLHFWLRTNYSLDGAKLEQF